MMPIGRGAYQSCEQIFTFLKKTKFYFGYIITEKDMVLINLFICSKR